MTKQVSETLETTTPQTEETTVQEEPKLLTQEQVDRLVGQARLKERDKYKGFEEYKAAYDELQEIKQADMTELEKEKQRSSQLQAKLDDLEKTVQVKTWLEEVSKETGVPAEVIKGNTKEEMAEHAEALKKLLPDITKPVVESDGFAPTGAGGKKATRDLFAETMQDIF